MTKSLITSARSEHQTKFPYGFNSNKPIQKKKEVKVYEI